MGPTAGPIYHRWEKQTKNAHVLLIAFYVRLYLAGLISLTASVY